MLPFLGGYLYAKKLNNCAYQQMKNGKLIRNAEKLRNKGLSIKPSKMLTPTIILEKIRLVR